MHESEWSSAIYCFVTYSDYLNAEHRQTLSSRNLLENDGTPSLLALDYVSFIQGHIDAALRDRVYKDVLVNGMSMPLIGTGSGSDVRMQVSSYRDADFDPEWRAFVYCLADGYRISSISDGSLLESVRDMATLSWRSFDNDEETARAMAQRITVAGESFLRKSTNAA